MDCLLLEPPGGRGKEGALEGRDSCSRATQTQTQTTSCYPSRTVDAGQCRFNSCSSEEGDLSCRAMRARSDLGNDVYKKPNQYSTPYWTLTLNQAVNTCNAAAGSNI